MSSCKTFYLTNLLLVSMCNVYVSILNKHIIYRYSCYSHILYYIGNYHLQIVTMIIHNIIVKLFEYENNGYNNNI